MKTYTSNPSKIKTLVDYYNRGLLTEKELLRLKREALGINVYTGKEKTNGVQDTRVFGLENSKCMDK